MPIIVLTQLLQIFVSAILSSKVCGCSFNRIDNAALSFGRSLTSPLSVNDRPLHYKEIELKLEVKIGIKAKIKSCNQRSYYFPHVSLS